MSSKLTLAVALAGSLAFAYVRAGSLEDHARFREYLQAGVTAFEARDFTRADGAFRAAVSTEPQQPRAVYNLAAVAAARGDQKRALGLLGRYAAMGVRGTQDLDADFPALKSLPGFAKIKNQLAQNSSPLCPCSADFDGEAESFIAEGIAIDRDRHRLLVSSIYARRIVTISAGRSSIFVATLPDGLSPLGLAADSARGLLWVAATSLPQSQGATPEQHGRSALLAFDLETGTQRAYYPAPHDTDSAFGDLAIAADGALYVTDSRGLLFRLKKNATALERFGQAGALASPQGIVVRSDNRYAMVADYALGLQRIDLRSGRTAPIKVPTTATTLGIDGVGLLEDRSFVATQNGLAPARIVRFRLSPDWLRVVDFEIVARASTEISDVSLIAADGDSAVLAGVSQWASFDEESATPARPLARWKLVRLNLR